MDLLLLILVFVFGILALYIGAEALVRGAVRIARRMGISPLVVGLTVVSFGTSAPEFMVSIIAALHHSREIAIGNIIGSNIANIGLIIGISALVKPLVVNRQILIRQAPILILSSFLVLFFFYDLSLSHGEGFALLFFMIMFMVTIVFMARKEQRQKKKLPSFRRDNGFNRVTPAYPISFVQMVHYRLMESESLSVHFFLVGAGILLLTVGSNWLIGSASKLAAIIGIRDVIIGISVVAVGTSLPELATSLVSAVKKEADISVGNIVGSNLFNTLFVLGFVGALNPIQVDSFTAFLMVPIMIAFTLVFTVIMWTKRRISRLEAGFLFVAYLVFINFIYLGGR